MVSGVLYTVVHVGDAARESIDQIQKFLSTEIPPPLGESDGLAEGETEVLGESDALAERESEFEGERDGDFDGLLDTDGEIDLDGETDLDGLLETDRDGLSEGLALGNSVIVAEPAK